MVLVAEGSLAAMFAPPARLSSTPPLRPVPPKAEFLASFLASFRSRFASSFLASFLSAFGLLPPLPPPPSPLVLDFLGDEVLVFARGDEHTHPQLFALSHLVLAQYGNCLICLEVFEHHPSIAPMSGLGPEHFAHRLPEEATAAAAALHACTA
eukprot:CAMPEP_0182559480 /NCGR_PEP_ID=MMETSP1324-20130603/2589_1 /TAXON_ID=236786 /ORGANISM="Florenciella sp., Strain RCC1587" /LENGTH=152 /DNA_ID=CAMNT_0024771745 /DNA_START=564 /DNA_END=1018 /DNA_ORIENTATION=-